VTDSSWRCPACGGTSSSPRFARSTARSDTVAPDTFVPSSDGFGQTVGALRQCHRCGHAALEEPSSDEVFEGAYTDAEDEVSLHEEPGQVFTATRDLEHIERFVGRGRLLDVGCWTGSFLVAAEARGWEAEGIEPSAWASRRAAARGCRVRQSTLDEVELEDGTYDAIVAADVIEHLVDPGQAIQKLKRALAPGGVLFLTVPDAGSHVARALGRRWWSVLPMHVQYFTRESMAALLESHGLAIADVRTHPKAFTVDYYAGRLEAFVPLVGSVAPAAVRAVRVDERVVSPDLRDRMSVIAWSQEQGELVSLDAVRGSQGAADPSPEGWPALDGLRGIAVAAVLVHHHDVAWLPGGFLGVSLLFTLAGFLLTNLLLREHAESGRIDVGRLWATRARHVLPIALIGVALAGVVAWITRAPTALGPIAGDLRAAGLGFANWRQTASPLGYGEVLSGPSPVTHYWAVAIEEQFHLVYPLLATLALRRGRRWLAAALFVATAASVATQLSVTDVHRAYLGTDSRLAELTIGSALALLWVHRARASSGRRLDIAGGVALAALLLAWTTVELGPRLFRGGLLAHAVGVAIVIAAALRGRHLPRLLGWAPFVWVGALGYGLYVVHFPVYLLLSRERTQIDGAPLLAARLAATLLLAILLHHLVERPVRSGVALPRWQGGVALATGLGIVVLLVTALPYVGRDDSAPQEVALGGDTTSVVTMPAAKERAVDLADPASSPLTPATTDRLRPDAPEGPPRVAGPERPLRMLVVGDSTGVANGIGLQSWAAEHGLASVDYVAAHSCSFSQDGVVILREGWAQTPPPACTTLLDTARAHAMESPPDVIVVFIGTTQIGDWLYTGDTEVSSVGEPAFDARYLDAARAALERLEELGAPVLLATLPVPSWDPTVSWPGVALPGSGPMTINDAGRTHLLNDLNARLASTLGRTRMVPYAELITGSDGSVSDELRPDGVHLDPDRLPGLMRDGLEDLLREAYRDVVRAQPGTALPGRTIWTP
jgi:peptidoglycan/LPS O-acetylase OafA/YrhL/SAM-dependent methyltransferase